MSGTRHFCVIKIGLMTTISYDSNRINWLHKWARAVALAFFIGYALTMKAVLAITLLLLSGCAVQHGSWDVHVLCNRTLINRDGLHYTQAETQHLHCDKRVPLQFTFAFN